MVMSAGQVAGGRHHLSGEAPGLLEDAFSEMIHIVGGETHLEYLRQLTVQTGREGGSEDRVEDQG